METGNTCMCTGKPDPIVSMCYQFYCRMVSVWDTSSGSCMFSLTDHVSAVHGTSVADGGNLAITGSADFCIRIWDLNSPPVSQETRFHDSDTLTVAVSPCGTYAVSGGKDSSIKVYDLDSMAVLKELRGHKGAINHIVVLRDSKHLLSASSDGSVRLWNGETEELVRTYQDLKINSEINCITVSADSELLMVGSEDGRVTFWSVKTGDLLKTFTNHKSAIISVAFAQSATAKYMISASRDGQVCTRDFYTAKLILSKQTHTDDLLCLTVNQDATLFATGSKDNLCHIINLPSGSIQAVLTGHKGPVRSIKFLQAGKLCLTASEDCTLCIWDISQSTYIAILYVDLPVLSCDLDRHEVNILYGTKDGWVSTALYCHGDISSMDTSTNSVNMHQNPMLKKLKGIKSPSSSSFAETESSQTSSLLETEITPHPDPVKGIEASSIPLPPSDDEESSPEDECTQSQTSCPPEDMEQVTARASEDLQDDGVALASPPITVNGTNENKEGSSLLQAAVESNEAINSSNGSSKKVIPDGFVDPEISMIAAKIKSDLNSSAHESSLHSNHDDTISESEKSKTAPPTSSTCTIL